ncbi:MAG: type II toxin-antitoxin system VapC family toxin, partial [Patescibacteria group bacterium]
MAYESLATVYQLPITFVSESEELAKETYRIAQKEGLTYYDASFIALAKQQRALLITDNPKHQGKSTEVEVKSLKDY